ncbi:MAG TPA: CoB--CoM heterodisulfide reductase iron-sulfur subunit A family protein [Spirochaetes bacterium]|nr:CoB--CoM heterodisulfide reductase iron-sulfur subunit A family protein [Spirochaetota bacterium]
MTEATRKKEQIVLFLCKCGSNISNFIDFDNLKQWVKEKRNVNALAIGNLLCSPKGKKYFCDTIQNKNIKSVVVAACSPKMHEKTFQDLAEEMGINMGKVAMANIREHCAWVTSDKNEATDKTKVLINAAIKRSLRSENLVKQTMEVNSDLLIIGGGIAGIQAALTMAKAGRKVYIVEKNISLGGSVIKTEEIAPNMECSPCLLAPVLSDVRDDPGIEVITNADVTDVLGFFGNFTVKVKKRARYVEENCIGCEECFSVCPVSVKSDFHHGLGERKAIHTLFPGSVPAAAVIDREHCRHFIDGSCEACVKICPFDSINFEQEDEEMSIQAGSIVVAAGFTDGDVSGIGDLGYAPNRDVYTTSEFERLASSNGPTGGDIQLKSGSRPSSVAVVHCAGSRRSDAIPYCSGICCTNALKVGELVRKSNPEAEVYNIHNDLVFSSPKDFQFYKKQTGEGTRFVRCPDLSTVKISSKKAGDAIVIKGDGFSQLKVDMVVLSTGLKPARDAGKLSELLNIDLDENGFFKVDHEILHTTGTVMDGIYIAGCSAMPANVANSVTQARAVAGDVLSKLIPGREIELEIMTSTIDEDKCAGCKLCIVTCPFKAITFDPEKQICVITEAICRGCGTCTATCPSGACEARHFTDKEIYAEIGGMLNV